MNRTILVMAGCATLLLGGAFAQDHAEFNAAMKTAGAANGSLRKSIAAKDGAETAATAEKLAVAFKTVQAHFEEHHMEDGIKFAQTANQASVNLAQRRRPGSGIRRPMNLRRSARNARDATRRIAKSCRTEPTK